MTLSCKAVGMFRFAHPYSFASQATSTRLGRIGPAAAQRRVEAVDLTLGVCDRGLRAGPGETDFHRGKWDVVDDDRLEVRTLDPSVPQAPSCFEKFDPEAIVLVGHCLPPHDCWLSE